jgi:YVTN family beta-propeller protein
LGCLLNREELDVHFQARELRALGLHAVETGTVWVANSSGGKVSRIDPATNEVIDTISLEGDPFAVVVDAREVWVTIYGDGKVSRIDLASNKVVDTIEVEGGPIAVAVDTRAVWAVNTDSGSVSRINRYASQYCPMPSGGNYGTVQRETHTRNRWSPGHRHTWNADNRRSHSAHSKSVAEQACQGGAKT